MSASPQDEPLAGSAGAHASAVFAWLLEANARAILDGAPLLTPAGASFLRQLIVMAAVGVSSVLEPETMVDRALPHSDASERRLWLGGVLLKEFRQPAPRQTAILDAFQARSWAYGHVSNPLPQGPGESEEEARQRLHDAIKNLNRGLPAGTIRFRGDGGLGVWWSYSESAGELRLRD